MNVFPGDSGNGEGEERNEAPGSASATLPGQVTASATRRALARARDGKPLDLNEATVLLHARGEDLHTLLGYASRTRAPALAPPARPSLTTYSPQPFIPLTIL